MEYTVKSQEVFKTGTGPKGPWTLYKITVDGYDSGKSFITGFDPVSVGDKVTITQKQNGEFVNHNYTKVKTGGVAASAPAGNADDVKKALKLMVLVAEQVGVEKEKIMEVLQG